MNAVASGLPHYPEALYALNSDNPLCDVINFKSPLLSSRLLANAFVNFDYAANRSQVDAVLQFIGQTALPFCDLEQPDEPAPATLAQVDAIQCSLAETYFADCLAQLDGTNNAYAQDISVYYDTTGDPLVFRKSLETSSGLTLRPMSIVGSTYGKTNAGDSTHVPAGTIVAIQHSGSVKKRFVDDNGIKITYAASKVTDPIAINPLRLTPWAYGEPVDRLLYALRFDPSTGMREQVDYRANICENIELADYQKAATAIMSFCGV